VQSFIEVDVTNIVKWRKSEELAFEKKRGEKHLLPFFMEAGCHERFSNDECAVDGDFVIKENINLRWQPRCLTETDCSCY
jgi:2-oxoglutarate dehydrogenase E2 component (dihydrolipoamide succinyltransferase)